VVDGDRLIWGPVAGTAAAAAPAGEQAEEYLTFSDSEEERIAGDSEFDDAAEDGEEEDGTDRCAEALAARLTLLGMCSEQPLLLLLDEADAAMLQQGSGQQTGGMFRAMLLSVLRQLPQVGICRVVRGAASMLRALLDCFFIQEGGSQVTSSVAVI
jgi:hypothetical protein